MPETLAVVFTGPGEVAFETVQVPEPNDSEVVVRTTWSWISNGTEGSYLRGERADGETPASAERPAPFPIVPGYQRVGVVTAAGAASGYHAGEVVVATISRVEGLALEYGGHLLSAPVHRDQVRRIPDGGPPPEAYAGLVLTQVGYNCGRRPDVAPDDAAVVIGDGLVGHWSAQTLCSRGARVLLAGRHAERLARFAGAGCTTVDTRAEDLAEAVGRWSPEGVQAVVDTVGAVADLERLIGHLRRFGHLVSAGYHHDRGRIDIQLLRRREGTLHAPSGWTGPRLDATLDLVRDGRLTTLPLVTDRLPADQVAEAWKRIITHRDRTLGVLLDWREQSA